MVDFSMLATGSKGNAVVLENTVLIDCGVSFKALNDVYKSLRLVVLTHEHTDHLNAKTLGRLHRERPALRFGCRPWLVPPLIGAGVSKSCIDVYENGVFVTYNKDLSLEAFDLPHNVPNAGYKLFVNGKKIIYATDTNSMAHVSAENFDLYLLEANYGEKEIVERIREKQAAGEYCHEYDVLKNHLSREKADDWLYRNMGGNSVYVYMHEHEGGV